MTANLVELARATAGVVDTFTDICEKIDQRSEVQKLKDAIVEKLRAYEAEAKERFRFAREKDDGITDLPNDLPLRRVN